MSASCGTAGGCSDDRGGRYGCQLPPGLAGRWIPAEGAPPARKIVVRGTMSLAATQERRYARGSYLGHRQVVQVTRLEPAGETTR